MIRRFRAWRRQRLERKLAVARWTLEDFEDYPFDPRPGFGSYCADQRIDDYRRRLKSRVGRLRHKLLALAGEPLGALPRAKIVPIRGRKPHQTG